MLQILHGRLGFLNAISSFWIDTGTLRLPREPNREVKSGLPAFYAWLINPMRKLSLKKSESFGNELRDQHFQKYPKYSRDTPNLFLWKRLVQTVTTTDILSPLEKVVSNNLAFEDESRRSSDKRHVRRGENNHSATSIVDDVMELTTIVKKIRDRNKRNTRTTNRSLYYVNQDITNKRFKRSTTSDDSKKQNNSHNVTEEPVTSTEKLYRHPKLSYEDEKIEKVTLESIDADNENRTNVNQFTDFSKRIWDIINGTRPSFKIVVPPMKTPRERQTAIFKKGHAMSASEVVDLNIPYNETGSLNIGNKKSLMEVPFDERRPSEEDELEKYVKVEVEGIDDRSTIGSFDTVTDTKPVDDRTANYNPNEAAYVENVNCSSDKTGSLNGGTEADDQIADSPDELGSYVENLNIPCDETDDESSNGTEKSSAIREALNESSSKDEKPIGNDQTVYDPDNIPYVEVPDYEDEREESLDEEDRRRAKEKNVDLLNISNVSPDFVGTVKTAGSVNSEREDKKDDSRRENLKSSDRVTAIEETREETESPENVQDDLNDDKKDEDGELDEESVLSAIHFDINEYKKPFNLDDFLKNEPFFAKLRKNKDGVRESSERDEVTGNEYSSAFDNNASVDFANVDEQEPRNESVLKNTREDHFNRDDYATDETGSEEIITEDLYRYGDKDFFKRLFQENRKKRDNLEMSAEEEDFLARYFSKDVVKKLKENSGEELGETEKKKKRVENNNKKKDTLKTLSSILEKKDRISRLDEEVNKKSEDGKNIPSVYKNYWSLDSFVGRPRKRKEAAMNSSFRFTLFIALSIAFLTVVSSQPEWFGICIRNCAQCQQIFEHWFDGVKCANACLEYKGKLTPDCANENSIGPFLKNPYN
ncbi:hypothetical protein KPH14_003823 [Odynerus spinipes]|uniref:Uncharacterized protein n=1 Tax=Odynerus spinipes TaxID=1348599 RepID=A0AAD9RY23_9HYME|nr:hypothetical protein KPH14_003823 [Odynerus spinipes]